MALPYYKPQTQVDWNSKEAYSQYRLWRKEVLRIVNGPLHDKDNGVKLNHVFIWAGAYVEELVEAKQAECPELKIDTVESLLACLDSILAHPTLFREAREESFMAPNKSREKIPAPTTADFWSSTNGQNSQPKQTSS